MAASSSFCTCFFGHVQGERAIFLSLSVRTGHFEEPPGLTAVTSLTSWTDRPNPEFGAQRKQGDLSHLNWWDQVPLRHRYYRVGGGSRPCKAGRGRTSQKGKQFSNQQCSQLYGLRDCQCGLSASQSLPESRKILGK